MLERNLVRYLYVLHYYTTFAPYNKYYMKSTTPKTNALRLLDAAKVAYQTRTYEVDETDLSAVHVAAQLHEDVAQVFKTLVLRGDKTGIFVCIIPGDKEVDLKKAAKLSGNKSCAMIKMQELLPITGYIRGGCSPIGMKKNYPMYIHQSCQDFEQIYISAGCRGMQVYLRVDDLIHFAHLTIGDLI